MASLFSEPVFQQVDSSGNVRPGSKLSFFESGTTTSKAVFTDPDLTIAFSQPVVSDAAGIFPSIYMDGEDYRCVYSDSNDVQLNVFDPISGTTLFGTEAIFDRRVETFTATSGQTVFDLANSYTPGTNQLQVWINGVFETTPENYTETNTTRITFTSGLVAGDFVVVGNLVSASFSVSIERQLAAASQTVFTLTTIDYPVATNRLFVYINGVLQSVGVNYLETSTTVVTFLSGLTLNDVAVFYVI